MGKTWTKTSSRPGKVECGPGSHKKARNTWEQQACLQKFQQTACLDIFFSLASNWSQKSILSKKQIPPHLSTQFWSGSYRKTFVDCHLKNLTCSNINSLLFLFASFLMPLWSTYHILCRRTLHITHISLLFYECFGCGGGERKIVCVICWAGTQIN